MTLDEIETAATDTATPGGDGAAASADPGRPPSEGPSRHARQIFGTFWIETTEFAIPVDAIQEVINEPTSFTPVPLSPEHMIGLFNLRGQVIPTIDLRMFLGFTNGTEAGTGKVAIIENGGLSVGLLFDETGGVLHSDGAAQVSFETNAEGKREVIVEGLLKLEDGKRMVQILDPFEILKIERLARVRKTQAENTMSSGVGQRLNCISFQLGHTLCAIDLRQVQEITDVPEVHTSQIAHGHTIGNIELRGQTMPVLDFRGVIGNETPHKFTAEALKSRKLLILSLEEGMVALLVFSIDSIITFYENEVLPFAKFAIPRQDLVAGSLIKNGEEIVILLDAGVLKRDPVLVDAARSCQEIYPSRTKETAREDTENGGQRKTFIVFSVNDSFAMDISHVSEVIDRPKTLLSPPYALDFVEGIHNLRGELITLISPRRLYELPAHEAGQEKVLIFRHNDQKYGIVVDSVDEIVNTTESQILDAPKINGDSATRLVSRDVMGCIQLPSRSRDSDPVMIIDVDALVARSAMTEP